MIYIVFYSKPGQPFLMRMLRRASPDSLQTRCGPAARIRSYEKFTSRAAAREVMNNCESDWREEHDHIHT